MQHPTLRAVFTLVVALAAALVLAGCGTTGGGSSAEEDGGAEADLSGGGEAGGQSTELGVPSLGKEDAAVVMTEYSDYQ